MVNEAVKNAVKQLSITEYLKQRGLSPEKENSRKSLFSSPFSSDSTPSFYHYKDRNVFKCYSTGRSGDIINLVQEIDEVDFSEAIDIIANQELIPIEKNFNKSIKQKHDFVKQRYLLKETEEDYFKNIDLINKYAKSRRITSHYNCAKYFQKINDSWKGYPSMMFIHHDEDLKECGAKFRNVLPSEQRFTSRGRLCFYVLEQLKGPDDIMYIMESETSANSLYEVLKGINVGFVILCIGGASNFPECTPEKYDYIQDRRIILDWDGGAKDSNGNVKYDELLKRFDGFGHPVKVPLEKGVDINSLYCENQTQFIIDNYYGKG